MRSQKPETLVMWFRAGLVFLTLGHGFISYMLSQSVVSDSATPWTAPCQAPLSMRILQARILEWVAMSSSRGSSQHRIKPRPPTLQPDFLPYEPPGKPSSPISRTKDLFSNYRPAPNFLQEVCNSSNSIR